MFRANLYLSRNEEIEVQRNYVIYPLPVGVSFRARVHGVFSTLLRPLCMNRKLPSPLPPVLPVPVAPLPGHSCSRCL